MTPTLVVILVVGSAFFAAQCAVALMALRSIRAECDAWKAACLGGAMSGLTRDACVSALERQIDLDPRLAGLRRMGTMAPLLGVVLTAGAIVFGDSGPALTALTSVGETGDSRGSAAVSLTPLFAGVCAGALLAIVNQLVQAVLGFAERRMVRTAVAGVAQVRFADNDDRIQRVAGTITAASEALQVAVGQLQSAARAAAGAAEELGGHCRKASSDLEDASKGFRTASVSIRESLEAAGSGMQEAMTQCAGKFTLATAALEELTSGAVARFDRAMARQAEVATRQSQLLSSVEQAARSFEAAIAPLKDSAVPDFQAAVRESVGEQRALAESSGRLLHAQRAWLTSAEDFAGRIRSASEGVASASTALQAGGHARLAQDVESLRNVLGRLSESIDAVGRRAEPVLLQLDAVTSRSAAFASALGQGQATVDGLASLISSASRDISVNCAAMSEATASLSSAVARAVAGIDPAGQRNRAASPEDPQVAARRGVPPGSTAVGGDLASGIGA